MTVTSTKITAGPYAGNGVSDIFSYSFGLEDKSEIKVFETDADGVQTELTVDTDYTVGGVGDETGGTVTRSAGPLPSGYEWYIRSDYKQTQETSFESQGAFFPDVHERAFDKPTRLIQQLQDGVNRSATLPDSYSGTSTANLPLPKPGYLMRWRDDGLGFENVLPSELEAGLILDADLSKQFDTISGVIADVTLTLGKRVRTRGLFNSNDGRGDDYLVVPNGTGTENLFDYFNLDNGLQVKRLVFNKTPELDKQTTGYKLAELDVSSLGVSPERFGQGLAFNSRTDTAYLYLRTAGSTDKNDERFRIVEFLMSSEGATLTPTTFTPELASGHQGISIEHRSFTDNSSIYMWTKAAPHLPDTASNEQTGKGCFRWDYQGATTASADRLQLYPDNGSGDPLEQYYNATPCISTDQNYLVVKVSSFGTPTTDQRVFIYDLNVINSLSLAQWTDPSNFNRDSEAYVTDWPMSRVHLRSGNFTQSMSCDGFYVYVTCGGNELTPENKDNVVYTMNGELVGRFDHTLGDPTLNANPPAGTLTSWEPEGGAIRYKDGAQLLTLVNAAFDDAGINRVTHQIWGLRDTGVGFKGRTLQNKAELGSDIHFEGGVPQEMSFKQGETLKIKVITDETTGDGYDAFVLQDDGALELRRPDDTTGSRVRRAAGVGREILELRGNTGIADGAAVNIYGDNDSVNPNEIHIFTQGDLSNPDMIIDAEGRLILGNKGQIKLVNDTGVTNIARSDATGRELLEVRANETLAQGAGINMYGDNDPTNPGSIINTLGVGGNYEIDNLPTSNPGGTGRLWNNSGVLNIT